MLKSLRIPREVFCLFVEDGHPFGHLTGITLPNICLCGLFRRRKEGQAVDGPERTCLSRHMSLVTFPTESKGQGISVKLKLKVGKPLLMKKAFCTV